MSNRISALVWEKAPGGGTQKLVLLALADAANQEGQCWPRIATIAKMADCSPRRVTEIITKWVKAGWVSRYPDPGHSNTYVVHEPVDRQGANPDASCPDAPSTESAKHAISQGREISQGSDDEHAQPPRNLAGTPAKSRGYPREISRVPPRNLAPRTVIEPKEKRKGTGDARARAQDILLSENQQEGTPDTGTPEPERPIPLPPSPIPTPDAEDIWRMALGHLRRSNAARGGLLSPTAMRSWIESARLVRVQDDTDAPGGVVCALIAPSSYDARQLRERFGPLVRRALAKTLTLPDGAIRLDVTVAPRAAQTGPYEALT